MISTIGFIAGTCTLLSMLPQIRRTYRTRRADDISMKMLTLLFIGASLWGVYGVLLEQLPIVLFNLVYLLLLGWQIALKRRYSKETISSLPAPNNRFCNQCMTYCELEINHEDWTRLTDDEWVCPYCLAAEQV